jgi:hypothetical protein
MPIIVDDDGFTERREDRLNLNNGTGRDVLAVHVDIVVGDLCAAAFSNGVFVGRAGRLCILARPRRVRRAWRAAASALRRSSDANSIVAMSVPFQAPANACPK